MYKTRTIYKIHIKHCVYYKSTSYSQLIPEEILQSRRCCGGDDEDHSAKAETINTEVAGDVPITAHSRTAT